MKKKAIVSLLLALCCMLTACSASAVEIPDGKEPSQPAETQQTGGENTPAAPDDANPFIDEVSMGEEVEIMDEMIPMSTSPAALPILLLPEASGAAVKKGNGAEIDYSNVRDGYVMARFPGANDKRLKVRVTGPSKADYDYNLPTGSVWSTFPLSDGNGSYKITVFQNTEGKKYATLASASFTVTLDDEFAPFLRPNQYVNYEGADNTIALAAELTKDIEQPLDKVSAVYNYVVKNLTYDKARATAASKGQLTGYLPDLDSVLAEKKGICFDYAALMAGMLRSQGVPCKLVVGYAGSAYHAWISVWTEEMGWVDGAIYFDGTTWHRMDPTFASSQKNSSAILKFIGDGSNYKEKYLY